MYFLHLCAFLRLNYLLTLILVLPLVACSGGDGGLADDGPGAASSNAVNLTWVAPSEREDGAGLSLSEIAGFRIYYGAKSGDYSNTIEVDDHTATQAVLAGIPSGTYFVAVTVVDVDGRESSYSSEVVITV